MTTDFPTWVLAETKLRGWSQATLAQRAGLSRSTVRAVLVTGSRKPARKFLLGIATAFEMPLVDVIVIWEAGERDG
jgi:lambda repressor-like predicted transcriptional regulator